MSLGAGGNRYQIQDLRSVELEELDNYSMNKGNVNGVRQKKVRALYQYV
jgi:hypothetical protein